MEAIQPHELMVGNWVLGEDGNPAKIEQIVPNIWIIEPPMPIPLTPEILEKAGFVKCKNGVQLTVLEGYVFIGSLFSGFPLTLEIDGNRMPLHHVKDFHKLQNLYFALTGEELPIEL